jgi:tRNA-Thr(GGU) m(6)t(6)A37 methyltransferase TsaA
MLGMTDPEAPPPPRPSAPAPVTSGPCVLQPIGWVRSPYQRRFGTPQQAAAVDSNATAVLELDPTRIPEMALADLDGVERIWILSWLHRGDGWSPTVRTPRGQRSRRGVFATRSPDRPNPIGLSAVRLLRVEGTNLHVQGIDLIDGTPVLDVKPYVPYADAFPLSRAGWIDEIPRDALQVARFVEAPPAGADPVGDSRDPDDT